MIPQSLDVGVDVDVDASRIDANDEDAEKDSETDEQAEKDTVENDNRTTMKRNDISRHSKCCRAEDLSAQSA